MDWAPPWDGARIRKRIRFTWVMGTAGLDHRMRAYMVGEADDTVSVDITATALPPDGAAALRH